LPSALYQWLFPDGSTHQARDIPTLQVSFGSNDEFFALDKNGKITYRDSIVLPASQAQKPTQALGEKKVPPSIATVARGLGFWRKKAYTVSSPSPTLTKATESNEGSLVPRMERRKTYMDGQSSSTSTLRAEHAQPLGSIREPGDTSVQINSWTPKHERSRSIFAVSEGQLKRLSRRSTLIEKGTEPTAEGREGRQQPVDQPKEQAIEDHRAISRSPTRSNGGAAMPPLALEAKQERMKQDRQRSFLVSTLPVRVSWPESQTILQARDQVDRDDGTERGSSSPTMADRPLYGNAEIQTSAGLDTFIQQQVLLPLQYEYSPQQHISIGVMSDFFRCQYRLGDALAFV